MLVEIGSVLTSEQYYPSNLDRDEPFGFAESRTQRLLRMAGGNWNIVPPELKLDAAFGVNRVALTFEKRYELESYLCSGHHPQAREYLEIKSSPLYDEIRQREQLMREAGLLQRGL